jgi:hypothetical protein
MKKDAEQLQTSLQRAEQGERIEGKLAPLVQTATLLSSLAEAPPPPPNQLLSGRHRFLTEAAHIRASKPAYPRRIGWKPTGMRLAGAMVAVILVMGMIFGAGYAAADSLPGDPLYALKLATETARLQWIASPEARADLTVTLVAERLDEITRLMEQRQAVDRPTTNRAKEQLAQALLAIQQVEGQAVLQAAQRLENTLQVREQTMRQAASTLLQAEQAPVLELLREMNRVRQELHTGQGEPNQQLPRLRPETPPALPATPEPAGQPSLGSPQEDRPLGPAPSIEPDLGPGPQRDDRPAGPGPSGDLYSGSGPKGEERPTRSQPLPGEPKQPDEPQPAEDPGPGSGSQPTEDPGSGPGSEPNADPGSGPGSQPAQDPGSGPGSQPNKDPSSGPGQQPAGDPDRQSAPNPQPSPGSGTDTGKGKP